MSADDNDNDSFYSSGDEGGTKLKEESVGEGRVQREDISALQSARSHLWSEDELILSDNGDDFESDDENVDDEDEDNHNSQNSYEKSSSLENKSQKMRCKVRNGHQDIDMTPPDQKLVQALKRAARYTEKKKSDLALRELIRCTALVRLVEGDGHWKLAQAHVKLASAYFNLKAYTAQAIYHTEIAESMIKSGTSLSEYPEDIIDIKSMLVEMYYTLGRSLTIEKKLTEADTALSKAEKICEDFARLPSVSEDEVEDWTIKLSLAIGRLSFRQQKYAVAMTYFEKALKLLKILNGEDSIELIPVYQSIGRIEQGKGSLADHSKAIESYLQAHSIALANYHDNSVEVADSSYALALAYAAVSDVDTDNSAETYMTEAVKIYEKKFGAGDEKVLEMCDELARLFIRTERVEEGIEQLQTSIPRKQDRYGDHSAQVAETWKLIGSSHLSLGDIERALEALQKCYIVECAVHGKNSRKSKDTQRTIDLLLANPNVAARQKKSKSEELKARPRFQSVARTVATVGGFKISN